MEVEPLSVGYSQEQAQAYYAEFLSQLRRVPGIVEATLDTGGALSGYAGLAQVVTPEGTQRVSAVLVGERYFDTLRIPFVSGRRFRVEDHAEGALVAVVNRTLATNLFGSAARAPGQTLSQDPGGDRTVVGVVENTTYLDLREPAAPIVYVPGAERARQALVHIGTLGDPASMIPTVHAVGRDVDPQVPLLSVQTFTQRKGLGARRERLLTVALSTVGWTALALSALGLYGLVAYTVVTRTRDIGIRAALGARRRHILLPFLKDTVRLVLTGSALGIGVALASSRFVENQLYGMDALNPTAHGGAIVLLGVVSLLAVFLPLRRALRVNPSVALRAD